MQLLLGDHVVVVMHPQVRALVDRVFAHRQLESAALPAKLEFPLRGPIQADELAQFYGLQLDGDPQAMLDELIRKQLKPSELKVGAEVRLNQLTFRVRELSAEGLIEYVGMTICTEPPHSPALVATTARPPESS